MKKPIVIESVQYEKGLSKDDIEVELVFSGRKDLQVISPNNQVISLYYIDNNKAVFNANENGAYKVVYSNDNGNNVEILKEIDITNIDKEAPVILNAEFNNGKLDIFLEDNLSGIDYKSTIDDLNKYNINNIEVDKSQNKLSIYLEEGAYNIKVIDLVGNYTVYDINIEKE